MTSVARGGCLLRAEKVSLELGGKTILRSLELEIHESTRPERAGGQVAALLGPSGIGKTQLFRILAGLQMPDTGTVRIGPAQEPVRAGAVGMVSQHYPLFEHRTVLGNLLVADTRAGLPRKELHQKAHALLARFGLEDRADYYPAQLSGGQRQRVAIAQQFMSARHFLLMDEPFSGLDPLGVDSVCALIREVSAQDASNTTLLITHDIEAALEVADILWLVGRDRLPDGSPVPGARVQATYDLVERGLAERRGEGLTPELLALSREIRERFKQL
jgi:polar amino acid transport system ATP-binding protein/sulfate transport system ATP-binding protein